MNRSHSIFAAFLLFHLGVPYCLASRCHPELLKALSKVTSRKFPERAIVLEKAARGIDNWDKFAKNRYGKKRGREVLEDLRSIDEKLEVLAIDPGIASRTKQLKKFIAGSEKKLLKLDPWELREAFKKHLGNSIVYRGLKLTEEEVEKIEAKGMNSKMIRAGEDDENPITKQSLSSDFSQILKNHMSASSMSEETESPLLSVTNYPKLAASVAKTHAETKRTKVGIYIFKLKVPKLDLISMGGSKSVLPYPDNHNPFGGGWLKRYENKIPFHFRTLTGKRVKVPVDKRLESFLLFRAEPEEILKVKKIK
jgi:hypothetical protein